MSRSIVAILLAVAMVLTLPLGAPASDEPGSLKEKLSGRWIKEGTDQRECNCGDCIDIQFEKRQVFCVESNQIYVTSYYRLDAKERTVRLYFIDPSDVGSGGSKLPWDDFDRRKPLATIDLRQLQKGTVNLRWHGFRSTRKAPSAYPFGCGYEGVYRKTPDSRHRPDVVR